MSLRWWLLAAAKARGKTLDEYIAGGWGRWYHIHEEIAFDMLEGMLETAKPQETAAPARSLKESLQHGD